MEVDCQKHFDIIEWIKVIVKSSFPQDDKKDITDSKNEQRYSNSYEDTEKNDYNFLNRHLLKILSLPSLIQIEGTVGDKPSEKASNRWNVKNYKEQQNRVVKSLSIKFFIFLKKEIFYSFLYWLYNPLLSKWHHFILEFSQQEAFSYNLTIPLPIENIIKNTVKNTWTPLRIQPNCYWHC